MNKCSKSFQKISDLLDVCSLNVCWQLHQRALSNVIQRPFHLQVLLKCSATQQAIQCTEITAQHLHHTELITAHYKQHLILHAWILKIQFVFSIFLICDIIRTTNQWKIKHIWCLERFGTFIWFQ